ncbi:hypothetical protein EG329_010676 [Mollisiaceae sp. DMI_Dod_QoI]|nr:hypothetical protein EG329_010676 [Helotiales sp. DMI_Dod_QoI]
MSRLPTRVIRVGTSTTSPSIVTGGGSYSRYAILSHCWGDGVPYPTTMENYDSRCKNIPFETLPKTFQEAITVTRALELEYLWIDDSCIIQYSSIDWQRESAVMGEYYKSADLTIAAADSTDGSKGLFRKRNPLGFQDCHLEVGLPVGNQKASAFSRQVEDHWSLMGSGPLRLTTLNRRAWCLQEAVLSRRILQFHELQMSWTCLEAFKSESTPSCLLVLVDVYYLSREILSSITTSICGVSESKKASCYNIWLDLIQEYSHRALTHDSDLLPAISGLADHIYKATSSEYLAGLWKEDFIRGLLWRPLHLTLNKASKASDERQPCFRPATYRAPSWSWASVDATRISYKAGLSHDFSKAIINASCFKLRNAEVKVTGANPFGEVVSGELAVCGYLKEAAFSAALPDEENLRDANAGNIIGTFHADETNWAQSAIWCLPVLWHPKSTMNGREPGDQNDSYTDDEEDQAVDCLALIPTGNSNEYVRVGLVVISDALWLRDCVKKDITII